MGNCPKGMQQMKKHLFRKSYQSSVRTKEASKRLRRDVTQSKKSKELCKVQDGPMNFNVAKYEKFIDLVSDSTLQVTFKKLLSNSGVFLEKNVHNYLKRPL